jgi:hypothetical protein
MRDAVTRREFVALGAMAAASRSYAADAKARSLETPYKLNMVLGPWNTPGAFDEKSVDCPYVFRRDGLGGPR